MNVAHDTQALHSLLHQWKRSGQKLALVPTMGNLHAGHRSLMDLAKHNADRVVVSIFVNELQFHDRPDFERYPRTPQQDLNLMTKAGADLAFIPDSSNLYPNGLEGLLRIEMPGLDDILCGPNRPGHFSGVCTVVCKLLHIVDPDILVLGKKDYQQLCILKKLIRDLNFDVTVLAGTTVREADGLALSSRNQHLSDADRTTASHLYQTLVWVRDQYRYANLEEILVQARAHLNQYGFKTEYIEVRETETLRPPTQNTTNLVVLVAAYLGNTRLIDNLIFRCS